MSSVSTNIIYDEVSIKVRSALGDKLNKIILYGSYARGDYDVESDIDIMVLADISENELPIIEKKLWNIGWDIGFDHNIMISIFLKNNNHFYKWLDDMAYYQNIENDGVVLYG
ncbi:MAG: nucleotidyltransferase domain-containing protein [Oscillospiraceae bacterium]|nr:nucleotidyltransferase domain-containing protein [Oscillospiraceae bacterium]